MPYVGIPEGESEAEKLARWERDRPLWEWFGKCSWLPCPVCNRFVSSHTYPELKTCFQEAVKLKYFPWVKDEQAARFDMR